MLVKLTAPVVPGKWYGDIVDLPEERAKALVKGGHAQAVVRASELVPAGPKDDAKAKDDDKPK